MSVYSAICTVIVSGVLIWFAWGVGYEVCRAAAQTCRRVDLLHEDGLIKRRRPAIYWREFKDEVFESYVSISFGGSRPLYQQKPYFRDEDEE